MKKAFGVLFSLLISFHAQSQVITQTIRGSIVAQHVENPLSDASVILLNTNPLIGTYTDENGNFKLTKVAVGTYTLKISYVGYKDLTLPNIVVNSGKETVLTIQLEENIIEGQEVVITAEGSREKPLNEMSTVSARTFSVEETQKYAAAVNDPARMALSFAGVVSADDGNNRIVIRGNSPNGLLWRMEGIDIPNPNHFSDVGSSGGGISILSAQLLANSDFITGAFASEYGNALSGAFDLKLRRGNNEKKEWTLSAGVLGINVAAEGPFSANYKGSYLVNYRYSTLSILGKAGVLPDDYVTNFQDLSYNIYLPTKKAGYFTLFGFGGLSDQNNEAKKDSSAWEYEYEKYSSNFYANTGAAGATHGIILNPKAYLKSAVLYSYTGNGYQQEYFTKDYSTITDEDLGYAQKKLTLSSVLNYKFDSRNALRTGVIVSNLHYDLSGKSMNDSTNQLEDMINTTGSTYTLQSYAQWQFRLNEAVTFNAGFHYLHLLLNKTYSLEPRAAISYKISDRQSLSAAYGLVSQLQPIGVYFAQSVSTEGNINLPNKELDLTKANHFVISYDYLFTTDLHLKTEVYYQVLFDVPISATEANSFSMLNNSGGDFVTDQLINNGTGKNYGIEFTLEKFLSHNYYALLSASLYESKYNGSDGIERDTRFNGNYAGTFTAGKDFILSGKDKNRVLGMNAKVMYSGGFRTTPINLTASQASGSGVYLEEQAFTGQNSDYFRADIGISYKRNRPKTTGTWSLDIQNVTNRKNVFSEYYEPQQQKVITAYQAPLIPVLNYKIEF
ncbi:MAG: TonB-dependent receptor [Chitinophagales bacterium]